jgi:predicted transport protein
MNKVIVAQINGLTAKYEKALSNLKSTNEYAIFDFEYNNYYKPFSLYILPEMKKHLKKNPTESFQIYEFLIHPRYVSALVEEMQEDRKLDTKFLKKLSDDITNDFNKLWISYKKMSVSIKDSFIQQIIKNRQKALVILSEHDPELAIKTIAKLKCPRLQFYLVNKLDDKITNNIKKFMETYCWERVMKILTEYCFYPQNIDPKEYFNQWEGEPFLHIKFCREIMGSRYNECKDFLKIKSKYQNSLKNAIGVQ